MRELRFKPDAAALLGSLVGDDTRVAYQEIQKLAAYVNYRRPIERDDVDYLTVNTSETSIFAMVDALGNQDGRMALTLLRRLLEHADALSIFGMIVRQFRLLLQAREVMDGGGRPAEIAQALKIHSFVAQKLSAQARHFDLQALEMIYHRLLEIDNAIKTGQVEDEQALETFIAAITTQSG